MKRYVHETRHDKWIDGVLHILYMCVWIVKTRQQRVNIICAAVISFLVRSCAAYTNYKNPNPKLRPHARNALQSVAGKYSKLPTKWKSWSENSSSSSRRLFRPTKKKREILQLTKAIRMKILLFFFIFRFIEWEWSLCSTSAGCIWNHL